MGLHAGRDRGSGPHPETRYSGRIKNVNWRFIAEHRRTFHVYSFQPAADESAVIGLDSTMCQARDRPPRTHTGRCSEDPDRLCNGLWRPVCPKCRVLFYQ